MVKLRKDPTFADLPVVLPNGGMVPAGISNKDFLPMAVKAWQDAGGQEKLTEIMRKDDDEFMDMTKHLLRHTTPKHVDVTASDGIEKLLERLDEAERANNALEVEGEVIR